MQIDPDQFQRLAAVVFSTREQGFRDGSTPLTGAQADAIVALAELASEADGREDDDEVEALDSLADIVHALVPDDDNTDADLPDDLAELAATLGGSSAELAYVVAYVVTIADLSIEASEEGFLEQLRAALSITEDRAEELIEAVGAALTPAE